MTDKEFLKQLGDNIRTARLAKRMTLNQVSSACNVINDTIGSIELGKRSTDIKTLKKIATALEVDLITLFAFTKTNTEQPESGQWKASITCPHGCNISLACNANQ